MKTPERSISVVGATPWVDIVPNHLARQRLGYQHLVPFAAIPEHFGGRNSRPAKLHENSMFVGEAQPRPFRSLYVCGNPAAIVFRGAEEDVVGLPNEFLSTDSILRPVGRSISGNCRIPHPYLFVPVRSTAPMQSGQ